MPFATAPLFLLDLFGVGSQSLSSRGTARLCIKSLVTPSAALMMPAALGENKALATTLESIRARAASPS